MSENLDNKNDILIINQALEDPDFLDDESPFKITFSVNTNKFSVFSKTDVDNICDYKISAVNNIYDNSKYLLFNILGNDSLKENFFEESQTSVNSTGKSLINLKESIQYLQDYFGNKSLVEEFYNVFYRNKASKYFGKVSNYTIENIINENVNMKIHSENNYFDKDQTNYFDFIDYSLIRNKTKDFFLYTVNQDNTGNSNFNINTFICQNFINLTQSMSTISTGVLSKYFKINNENYVSLDGENNFLCETIDTSNINYFSYIKENNFNFNIEEFTKKEIVNKEMFSESYLNSVWLPLSNKLTFLFTGSNRANFSYKNILRVNAKRKVKIYPSFYKKESVYNFEDNSYIIDANNTDVIFKDAIKEIDKALTNIKSVNLSNISSTSLFWFNRYLLNQTFLGENNLYNTNFELERDLFSDILFQFDNNNQEFYLRNQVDQAINVYGDLRHSDDFDSCISLQVLNQNLSKNIGMIYIDNNLAIKSIAPALSSNRNIMSGQQNSLEIKNFDSNFSFCENVVGYSTKLDSIIKKIKIKSLNNKNIDLSTLEQTLKNIKSKKTNSKIIGFSTNNLDNLQLAKKGENLQKIISTFSGEEFYSNYSLNSENSSFNEIKGLVEKVYNGIENNNVVEEAEKINEILKNYYVGNYYQTSSVFFRKVLDDVLKESKIVGEDSLFTKKTMSQYLYLKYFLESKNEKVKKLIVDRFVKKAISKYGNCSNNVKKNTNFKFKVYDLNLEDYEIDIFSPDRIEEAWSLEKENQINNYYNDLEDTNTEYKLISNEVFSQSSIENISTQFNYKKIDNVKISLDIQNAFRKKVNNVIEGSVIELEDINNHSNFRNIIQSTLLENVFSIKFNCLKSFLPFHYCYEKKVINEGNKTGNKIFEDKMTVLRYNKSDVLFENKLVFDNVEKNEKIHKYLYLGEEKDRTSFLEIQDLFDDIINNNFNFITDDYIFVKICISLYDLIKTLHEDFELNRFETIDDVNSFLTSNNYILDFAYEIIEKYSEIYDFCIKKIHHDTAMKFLSYDLAFSDNVEISQSEYQVFGLTPTGSTSSFEYLFKNLMPINVAFNVSKNHSQKTKEYISDVLNVVQVENSLLELKNIKDSLSSYETVKSLSNSTDITKSKAANQISNIASILLNSDIYQVINFDLVKMILNFYNYNIASISQEVIKSKLLNIDFIDDRELAGSLFNTFYLNKLYENLDYLIRLNQLFKFSLNRSNTPGEFLGQNSFLEDLKRNDVKTFQLLKNATIENSMLNGDIYNLNISLKEISSINKENLIKIKINIIDHNRLDRVFLPKVLLYSPLIFDPHAATFEKENLIGYYNFLTNEKIMYREQGQIVNNDFLRFVVNNKVVKNILNDNVISNDLSNQDIILSYIEDCHLKSSAIEKILNIIHGINLDEKNTLSNISKNTFNKINSLSAEKFVEVFNRSKSEISNLFKENEDQTYKLEISQESFDVINLLDNINKATSIDFYKKVLNSQDYMNINFDIIPEEFLYFVQSNVNDQVESNVSNVVGNQTLSNLQKMYCAIENINLDFIRSNNIYKITNSSTIDNYSISIDIEVI